MKKSIHSVVFGIGLLVLVWACKRDEPELIKPNITICDTSMTPPQWECKNTAFQLVEPEYFPPFPQRIKEKEFTVERIALGRKLFFEKKLSGDNTMSCGSCHNQKLGFTDNGKAVSVGIDNIAGTKNSMALFNLAYSPAFFWDGRAATLEKQALLPVEDPIEMHESWQNAINKLKGDEEYTKMFYEAFCTEDYDSTHAAEAITQFELTLISGNSEFDKGIAATGNAPGISPQMSEAAVKGWRIFNSEPRQNGGGGDCFHCHSIDNSLFTNNQFMNNGIKPNPEAGFAAVTGDDRNWGQFKVPSLRNIEHTGPYMHDGSIETLEEVIEFYNSGVHANSRNLDPLIAFGDTTGGSNVSIAQGLNLSIEDKANLLAFLKALSDPDFLNNSDFSDQNN